MLIWADRLSEQELGFLIATEALISLMDAGWNPENSQRISDRSRSVKSFSPMLQVRVLFLLCKLIAFIRSLNMSSRYVLQAEFRVKNYDPVFCVPQLCKYCWYESWSGVGFGKEPAFKFSIPRRGGVLGLTGLFELPNEFMEDSDLVPRLVGAEPAGIVGIQLFRSLASRSELAGSGSETVVAFCIEETGQLAVSVATIVG